MKSKKKNIVFSVNEPHKQRRQKPMNDNRAKYAINLTKPNESFFIDNYMQDALTNAVNSQKIKNKQKQTNINNRTKYVIILTKPNDLFFIDNDMQNALANAVSSQSLSLSLYGYSSTRERK